MRKHEIFTMLLLVLIFLFMASCTDKEKLEPENVLQVNTTGLREGVFMRRYMLTSDYGSNKEFTAEILKNFIKEKLEQNYLFIAHAYELGLDKENLIQRKVKDFRVNLIAGNHPLKYQNLDIPQDELKKFYQKKVVKYDIDLIQSNSYGMADSMYKFLLAGKKMDSQGNEKRQQFPLYTHYENLTYGQNLHPNLTKLLPELKKNQVCEPVYTSPTWSVMRLNKKSENKHLASYDKMLNKLIQQKQIILKFEDQSELLKDLKEKYKVTVNKIYYPDMISAYTFKNNHSWIEINKIKESNLNNTFIKIGKDKTSLLDFILTFNENMQFLTMSSLDKEDIDVFIDNFISKNLLYLDGLEKGIDQDELTKDKLINKEHRLLLSKYLNEEIAKKINITESDAVEHYENNKDKWMSEYKVVEKSVKYDLRKTQLNKRRDELVEELRNEYNVQYNESLLQKLADQLTASKKDGIEQNVIQ